MTYTTAQMITSLPIRPEAASGSKPVSERNDIGVMIRAGSRLWVMRASDLVHHPRGLTYFHIFGDWEHSHPVYGTEHAEFGSVWRYQSTAENYINRNGIVADLFWTEIKPTGKITSDGRKHLVPVTQNAR